MKKVLRDLEALREGMAAGRGFDQMRFDSPEVAALAKDLLRHYAKQDKSLEHASASLSKAKLEKEQYKSSLGELQKILDLCRVISSSEDLKDILHHLVFLLSEILPSRGCAVFVGRDGTPGTEPVLASNFTPDLRKILAQHVEEGIIRWALAERRVCLIPSFDSSEAGGFAAIPLLDNGGEYGFIWIASTIPHDEVTAEIVNLAWVLASHASVAILNCLHRLRMEEKINELRILTSINTLKTDILRQGAPREEGGLGSGSPGEGNLPVFFGALLKLISRELRLDRGWLILSNPAASPLVPTTGSAAAHVPGGANGPPGTLSLQPPHPVLGESAFLDHPETRKILRLADREQVRLEAGDFFATAYPVLSRSLGSEGLAALSLAPLDARPGQGGVSAWLLLPLAAADLQRIPMLQNLLLAIVSQARVVAENIGLYDSLLAANRNLTSLQWQLVHSGKMAALGQLAGGVAHEINNPLQIMLGRIQMVQMMAEDKRPGARAKVKEETELVTGEILRIRDIVRNLLDFSRQGKRDTAYAPVSLGDTLKDVLALLDHQLRSAQVEVRLDLDAANPRVLGNRNQLKQVFINLMMNAIHAMEGGTRILEVRTTVREGMAQASIRDTGIGIPEENIPRIFEPFFSTKALGTGLGLSISYGLVKDHKGTMEVESVVDRGACFTIRIPQLADEAMGYNLLVG